MNLMSCGVGAKRARGAVSLIAVMFLFTVIMAVLGVIFLMSATDIFDSQQQSDSVKALLLAESAVERAMGRLALGNACASLAEANVGQGSGTITIAAPAVVGANCQFRASGAVGNVSRTVNALASIPSGSSVISASAAASTVGAGTSRTLSYTVPAGASILLVGISVDHATATISMTYGGAAMTTNASLVAVGPNPWPKAQIFYLINPPAGTANVVATISPSSEAVMGAMAFSGVNVSTGATAPFDVAPASATGNGKTASVSITPATSGAWVFDVLAINQNDPTTMTPAANRTSRWNTTSSGNVRGDASTTGPISPIASPTTTWTWTGNNNKWSQLAVALRPGSGSPSLVQWSELVSN